MENFIRFLFIFILSGCSAMTVSVPRGHTEPDSAVVVSDASSQEDALSNDRATSQDADSSDDRVTPVEDASSEPEMFITYDGPVRQRVSRGSQDAMTFRMSLTSLRHDLEIRSLPYRLMAENEAGRVRGSRCSDLFTDIKVKDLDTGETIMGPVALPSALACGSRDSGLNFLRNAFAIREGTTRHLAITLDVSAHGDEPSDADLVGQSFSVTVGYDRTFFAPASVRRVSDGTYVRDDQIVNNTVIRGNPFTITSASLHVSLAATPVSSTHLRNETNIPTVGVVFTAGAESDILVPSIRYTGRGNVDGTFFTFSLQQVVTSCAMFDGTTRVGTAHTPDASSAFTTAPALRITRGTSRMFVLQCTADSVVAQAMGDRFHIGIAGSTDIVATDADGNTVFPTVDAALSRQANGVGGDPPVIVTVMRSGTLTIVQEMMSPSGILVAGGRTWHNMAQFRACAMYEDARLDMVNVRSRWDAASYAAVAIAMDGRTRGSAILPAGTEQSVDVNISSSPIVVPSGRCTPFHVWGQLAPVVASSTVSGRWDGVARSGAQVALGLNGGLTTGEWDRNYAESYNIRATGMISGERLYVARRGSHIGPIFVVRRSFPTIIHQPLASTTLANGMDTDIVRYQIAADLAGPVAMKRVSFFIRFDRVTGSTLDLTGLRMRRAGADLPLSECRLIDENGRDLSGSSVGARNTLAFVTAVFTNEEVLSGAGNTYRIHGVVSGAVPGDQLSVFLATARDFGPRTGFLTDDAVYVSESGRVNPGPHLDTGDRPGMTDAIIPVTILWSDMSEVPHSALPGWSIHPERRGGSRDWTDSWGIVDFGWVQRLSR